MAAKSISISRGPGAIRHNNREFIEAHVDRSRTPENIVYIQQPLEEAYEQCFGAAVAAHNARQTRSDRRIDGSAGYLQKIRQKSLNGQQHAEQPYYEIVVQIGNQYDSRCGTAGADACREILDDYMRTFSERNPHLYVFNAVMHLDEQTPHIHVDFIPVAGGYQKGMPCRNSLSRALQQQGIESGRGGKTNNITNRTTEWYDSEKSCIEALMRERGIDRKADTGLQRERMPVNAYKAVMAEIDNRLEQLPDKIDAVPAKLRPGKVIVDAADLEQLQEREKLVTELENAAGALYSDAQADRSAAAQLKSAAKADRVAATETNAAAEKTLERAKSESDRQLNSAAEVLGSYRKLYDEQLDLNNAYSRVVDERDELAEDSRLYKELVLQYETKYFNLQSETDKKINDAVEAATAPLTAQIEDLRVNSNKSTENAVEAATAPLKRKIEQLQDETANLQAENTGLQNTNHLQGQQISALAHCVADMAAAIQTLTDDLPSQGRRVVKAISNIAKRHLKGIDRNDLADDIDRRGRSESLPEEIDQETRRLAQATRSRSR